MPVGTNEFQVLTFGDFGTNPTQIGEITYNAGAFYVMTSAGILNLRDATASTQSNVQIFTSNGTWTKPANVTMVSVVAIGGGGGGGSGGTRVSSGASARFGGQGGTGAGVVRNFYIPASFLDSTVSVSVGAGGTGGLGRQGSSSVPAEGLVGNAGGVSSFGTFVGASGGNPGLGGGTSAGTQQNGPPSDYPGPGGSGAIMRSNGGTQALAATNISRYNPAGGGGGQGYVTSGTVIGGNAGASTNIALGTTISGGTFSSGVAGGSGNSAPVNSGWGGAGGGGGGVGNARPGGNGGLYGGGGGGGGVWNGATSGFSGAGGTGGNGIVIVISW